MKVLYVITFLVYYSCYSYGYYIVLTSTNCLIVRLFSDAVCHRIYNKRRYISLGEFPGYWDWLRDPGLPPVLVSIAFPPLPSISLCFSIHSSSPAIEFHSCFFFTTDGSAPTWSTLHLLSC